jgi:riboflavin kinase/FMN adenylyltransferase
VKVITSANLQEISTPTAVALGNFDGVHLGHQRVIAPIVPSPLVSTVVSFQPHPQEFFQKISRPQLTPLPEKIEILQNLGVKQFVLLTFDQELAQLSAPEFIEQILQAKLQAERVSVGFNFRFGRGRKGSVADLKRVWGKNLHTITEQCLSESIRISSTNIRAGLSRGDLPLVFRMLGRPYSLVGQVVPGQQLARKLGFPTANLRLPEVKFLPRYGVYGVQVDCVWGKNLAGVMNIGCRPTVVGEGVVCEVHILGGQGDLYGTEMRVRLISFIRSEQKFNSVEELRLQIAQDCLAVQQQGVLV